MATKLNKSSLPSGLSAYDLKRLLALKVLYLAATEDNRTYLEIDEISIQMEEDEKETWRFLYGLEGQKYVAPVPSGDLTSRKWMITEGGIKAIKRFSI